MNSKDLTNDISNSKLHNSKTSNNESENSKVSISSCNSYNMDYVKSVIEESLKPLGGISNFVSYGDKVLLKPNMLMASDPSEHITTHPIVVEAVANLVIEAGGIPVIGDSPAGLINNLNSFYKKTGFFDVADRLGIELANFEKEGSYIKHLNGFDYPIAKRVIDSDVVINLPKIKTHGLTIFSCGIKNMYGTVPGFRKGDFHRYSPNPSDFAERVVDIFSFSKPDLTIVDGIYGMDGMGPSGGNSKFIGVIISSNDAVALDNVICKALGKDVDKIHVNRIAKERKLGTSDLNDVKIYGDDINIESFIWPSNIYSTLDLFPKSLTKMLFKLWWTKPAIYKNKCINCNKCLKACPVEALFIDDPTPIFKYKKCINCLCCMEVCPKKAMYQKQSTVYKISTFFSKIFNK